MLGCCDSPPVSNSIQWDYRHEIPRKIWLARLAILACSVFEWETLLQWLHTCKTHIPHVHAKWKKKEAAACSLIGFFSPVLMKTLQDPVWLHSWESSILEKTWPASSTSTVLISQSTHHSIYLPSYPRTIIKKKNLGKVLTHSWFYRKEGSFLLFLKPDFHWQDQTRKGLSGYRPRHFDMHSACTALEQPPQNWAQVHAGRSSTRPCSLPWFLGLLLLLLFVFFCF